jgi:hypothetical protein
MKRKKCKMVADYEDRIEALKSIRERVRGESAFMILKVEDKEM